MKLNRLLRKLNLRKVAPFAGAWIEISKKREIEKHKYVAPFAGAWIEIQSETWNAFLRRVAPFAGAWIEMYYGTELLWSNYGRSLRGSVD